MSKPLSATRLHACTLVEDGRAVRTVAYCGWDECVHRHGLPAGQLGAHCEDPLSPFLSGGYLLTPEGTVASEDETKPDAPCARRRKLARVFEQAGPVLRKGLLATALGRRFGELVHTGQIGDAEVRVAGDGWTIQRPGRAPHEDKGAGRLLAALWGLPEGVAAVRFLAILFPGLDAKARMAIAGAVEESETRRAAEADARRQAAAAARQRANATRDRA